MELPIKDRQKLHFWPTTTLGRWTLGLGIAALVVFLAPIPLGGYLLGLVGLAALVVGSIAVVVKHERSISALLATAVGLLMVGLIAVMVVDDLLRPRL